MKCLPDRRAHHDFQPETAAGRWRWTSAANARRIADHAEAASQFLEAAAWARGQRYDGVFVDTLFSATELIAKGFLLWMPDRTLLDSKKHSYVEVRFKYQRKLENVDARFVELLTRLWKLSQPARVHARDFVVEAEIEAMLAVAKDDQLNDRGSAPGNGATNPRKPPRFLSRAAAPEPAAITAHEALADPGGTFGPFRGFVVRGLARG
jgi:hypothetical protein